MAKNEKLTAAKTELKAINAEHKINVKALAAAQKAVDKTAAKVAKAEAQVAKHTPTAE